MRDPYSVLGVPQSASAAEIKSAYRKLAREKHPDVNPGDAKAESAFRDISAAYDLLGDADKRRQFDQGMIDANGNPRFHAGPGGQGPGGFGGFRSRRAGGHGAGHPGGSQRGFGFDNFFDGDDVFSEMFSQATRSNRPRQSAKGADARYKLDVPFMEAASGGTRTVKLSGGKTLNVKIPAGAETGQILRLKGQGVPSSGGQFNGDALIELTVKPHAAMHREGLDIHADLPVSVGEAIRGTKLPITTPSGRVMLTVPEHSNGDTLLRLRGKGISKSGKKGDFLVRLRLLLDDPEREGWLRASRHEDPQTGPEARKKIGFE